MRIRRSDDNDALKKKDRRANKRTERRNKLKIFASTHTQKIGQMMREERTRFGCSPVR